MSELTVKLKNEFRGGEGRPLLWPCVAALAAAFLLLLLGRELLTIMKIDVWRFDAVYNFDDYFSYKFRTEGRWLVCLLFPLLRLVPAHLSILLHLACLWLFGYCCCRNFTEDRAYSALFGLALLQIHPYFSIFGWPTTTLPTVLCLAGLALARDKLPLPWFFVAGGVLFHGGFNNEVNRTGRSIKLNYALDAPHNGCFLLRSETPLFNGTIQPLGNIVDAFLYKLILDITDRNLKASLCHNLCNAAAHLTSADD